MRIAGKVALITGASSGIGRALAVELGLRGAHVVIAARSPARLRETSLLLSGQGVDHRAFALDITRESSITQLLASTSAAYGGIDILVNNAGVGLFQTIAATTFEDAEMLFRTNFWGPFALMHAAAPLMNSDLTNSGLMVNISSAASKYAPARQGMYAASKAALERVSEALGLEEKRFRTMVVVPDRTATPFMDNVMGPRENAKLGLALQFATAEHVARRIAAAIEHDAAICYTTGKSRLYSLLSAVTPSVVRGVNKRMSASPQ